MVQVRRDFVIAEEPFPKNLGLTGYF